MFFSASVCVCVCGLHRSRLSVGHTAAISVCDSFTFEPECVYSGRPH